MRSNLELAELLARESREQTDRKQRALRRAARHALTWPVEAAATVAAGDPLTSLRSVGPYVARVLEQFG